MKSKLLILFLGVAALITSCKKGDQDFYRMNLAKTAMLEGDWEVVSYLQNGEDLNTIIEKIKSRNGDCDTQYLTHTDSILYQVYSFGKKGNYTRARNVNRIDTSFLPSGITDTACTNKYNYIRSVFDTTIISNGFWTFTGSIGEIPPIDRLLLVDTKTDSAEIWDIQEINNEELRLYRKYNYNSELIEEELRLLAR